MKGVHLFEKEINECLLAKGTDTWEVSMFMNGDLFPVCIKVDAGKLSLLEGTLEDEDSVTWNDEWCMKNWKCPDQVPWYTLARFLRDESLWRRVLTENITNKNFFFYIPRDDDRNYVNTILMVRKQKPYCFIKSEVIVSEHFGKWIIKNTRKLFEFDCKHVKDGYLIK
jgi:hypothetical protein